MDEQSVDLGELRAEFVRGYEAVEEALRNREGKSIEEFDQRIVKLHTASNAYFRFLREHFDWA
jgi:hypothetical protein